MTSQSSLWQSQQHANSYAELCNALYERELNQLVKANLSTVKAMQGRLKSLPHYIKRTAFLMTQAQSPLLLDVQNASWSAKQSKKMPLTGQTNEAIWQWYQAITPAVGLGLVVPIAVKERILLDSIDRIDVEKARIRTNACGWFSADSLTKVLFQQNNSVNEQQVQLLKPNKKIMMAACAGHRWQSDHPVQPVLLTLRELLLSCAINWKNFKSLPKQTY